MITLYKRIIDSTMNITGIFNDTAVPVPVRRIRYEL